MQTSAVQVPEADLHVEPTGAEPHEPPSATLDAQFSGVTATDVVFAGHTQLPLVQTCATQLRVAVWHVAPTGC